MSKVTEPGGKTTSYLYDKAGNRIQETVIENSSDTTTISTTTTYEYNEQNRLTETVTRSGFVTEKVKYDYDNNGNTLVKVKETTKPVDPDMAGSFAFARAGTTTTREVAFMEYNVWNQMVKTIDGDKTLTYRYNGEGYRVEKAVNGQITRYMYEADKVILEVDIQGNETARNVYGSNLLMREAGSEQYYYMYNGHGDVTALLGRNGEISATYYYDAFGNITEQTGEADNPIRYAGYQYDEETEIYYLNARYYDSKIARFLTEDTYRGDPSDPLSLNLYTYCQNEPMMYSDPSGLRPAEGATSDEQAKIDVENAKKKNKEKEKKDKERREEKKRKEAIEKFKRLFNQVFGSSKQSKVPKPVLPNSKKDTDEIGEDDFSDLTTEEIEAEIEELSKARWRALYESGQLTAIPDDKYYGGEPVEGTDEPKLSQTDSDSILALRNLFDVYKSKNNLSGMDATMRAIQEIQMKNGIDVEDYAFASSNKTTRVSTDIAHTFSLDDIHNLQKGDDVIGFLGGAIPTVGPVLGPLSAFVNEVEQNGKASIGNTAKNIGLGALGAKETGIGLVASGVDTGISMNKPKNDTYNRDGVTIQAGDSYILLRTETNQGLDVATIKVYVRDDKIISYEQFGPYDSPGSYESYDNIIKSKWKKDGYK